MKLEKLILDNFRQFRGRQELTFSSPGDRNITVIHGENTVGKTALLNALLWGFYGHDGLSDDLPRKERIINQTVAAAAKDPLTTEASVTILFEHENTRYTLRRSLTLAQQTSDAKKTDLRMDFVRDGQTLPQNQPQSRISSIMPLGISQLLFFNGERIDHLGMEKNASKITDAIHQMLGLKLLKTAIEDLKHNSVSGKLRAELREKTSDAKKALIDRQIQIDESIERLEREQLAEQDNLASVGKDLAAVKDKLLANKTVHELQKRRNELTEQQKKLLERRTAVNKRLGQAIAEDGFTLFTPDLVQRGRTLVSKLRSEGAIPARVLNSFIEELLQQADCICHRPLPARSPERQAVEQLLTRAGDANFNNAVGALDNALGVLAGGYERTREGIREANAERLRLADELTDIGEELAAIGKKIVTDGKDDEEALSLETKRDRLVLQEDEHKIKINHLEGRLQQLVEERAAKTKEIEQLDDQEAAAKLAQERLNTVEHSATLLADILRIETEELRPLLNDEIKKHFQKIVVQPYWPDLSEDFVLSIRQRIVMDNSEDSIVEEVGPSTGMRQVTSLVFIASLLALAKIRSTIPTILRGLSGSEYPIVMDSPFGSLSTRFREGVTRWVPSLAPEVVLLVSDTQYRDAVANTLRETKKVGRCYQLRLHGPGLKDKEGDALVIDGQSYQRYFEATEEFSDIVEIES